MPYIYDQRKRLQGKGKPAPERTTAPGPDIDALMSGTARPSAAQKGRPIDLDAAMKAKMENAFGDLSSVKLYESAAVGQAGAEAITQGNEIAFAPGMADFSSRSGQERLGHELSHVMSQRSGAVRGEGFLASASLEVRADREGAMAAAGGQVYAGPVAAALSDAAPSPFAAGPMQAKRRDEDARNVKDMQKRGTDQNWNYAVKGSELYDKLDQTEWEEKTHTPGWFSKKLLGKKDQTFKVRRQTEEQKKASKEADDLFAIYYGINYTDPEDPKNKLITDNEEQWFDYKMQNPTLPLLQELTMRSDLLGSSMLDKRDALSQKYPEEGEHPVNFMAAFSNEAQDYNAYSSIARQMMFNQINHGDVIDQFQQELRSASPETKKMREDAKAINVTSLDTLKYKANLSPQKLQEYEDYQRDQERIILARRKDKVETL